MPVFVAIVVINILSHIYSCLKELFMRFFGDSAAIIAVCFCVLTSNGVIAAVSWDKDLVYDTNTNTSLLASCLEKDANSVFVITKVCPKGTFPKSGICVLWEIRTNGNLIRQFPLKNTDGNTIKTDSVAAGPGCAIAIDSLGNLLTINALVLGEREKSRSISAISLANSTEPNILMGDRMTDFSVKKLLSMPDNNFVLVGGQKDNGFCAKINNQGKIQREVLFDIGQLELFTDAALTTLDDSNLVVVGLSAEMSGKVSAEKIDTFIAIYDPNCKLISKDIFSGGNSLLLPPRVCCFDNGNIMVLYIKRNEDNKPEFWARCYTQKLEVLWEKTVYTTNKSPFYWGATSRKSSGFVVGTIPQTMESVEFYFFDKNGTQIGNNHYKGMVSASGFNLMRANNGKTIAVFEEGSAGSVKELTIKTKIIALD